jgi:hypothetical protein
MPGSLFAFLPSLLFSTRSPATPQSADLLSVMPLLSMARELAALFVPLQPARQFRDDLERSLIAAARQQNARVALAGYDPYGVVIVEREGLDRRWVVGAAAAAAVGSAVSIAGIMAYVWRRRGDRAA